MRAFPALLITIYVAAGVGITAIAYQADMAVGNVAKPYKYAIVGTVWPITTGIMAFETMAGRRIPRWDIPAPPAVAKE